MALGDFFGLGYELAQLVSGLSQIDIENIKQVKERLGNINQPKFKEYIKLFNKMLLIVSNKPGFLIKHHNWWLSNLEYLKIEIYKLFKVRNRKWKAVFDFGMEFSNFHNAVHENISKDYTLIDDLAQKLVGKRMFATTLDPDFSASDLLIVKNAIITSLSTP
ncbi:MAG: hypothetical protein Lokiarch_35920 [Candidatus Lokiarchaeum sp. GC14_75]|nr:MAG: hypothetical protein Lokiarch_35920 [Candidatus Lokiarchaeum sp. GC14_75]